MPDLPGLLCTAEDEIIILCPVILPAKPSCLLQNTPFNNKKMTNENRTATAVLSACITACPQV